jgi:metal-dependent hydrolase (beta-lactamase superfamily II)
MFCGLVPVALGTSDGSEVVTGRAHEAVHHIVAVKIDSWNRRSNTVSQGALVCTGARSGRVEHSDSAVGITKVAAIHAVGIQVPNPPRPPPR